MDPFLGIRFKKTTAKRFQEFSRKHFKTHTEAMETMLDFFLYNEISPKEHLGPTGRTLEAKLLKRINAVIAIIKDVEKNQTKPTQAMLEALFTQTETPEEKPLIIKREDELDDARFEDWDGKDF
ncbi:MULTISPECIES: BfmA/BtgA family mobilization protein [Leeuwenhoekiella]|uniref:BfmA/BtgA family mobilization protein n=1 Tax=Leeuwenhoekiella TaxID=283735 RepID=UPI000C534920|nr:MULTISPECIES: BfmA/BtgA family mobilization protein [Leeuwenhoekiella]MAO43489.1 hypothetical protein [Leeuwenhoekiella sp.]MBQ51966.1 hypothetical protein [Leeuwenhoekiella sp.]HBO30146.1 hypothetical protein [Leeuwenhoekiella sp.]HBT08080.1 hypothetical protein [Leeuwenhoekiella sp.]HCQ76537.1 hypothetical protein [Leeuwenhoekiella sp.]